MTSVLDFAEKMVELAMEKPDLVYNSGVLGEHGDTMCLYLNPVDQTKGSCLVGQAAIACGVSPEVLREHEGRSAFTLIGHLLDQKLLDGADGDLQDAIDSTQTRQDGEDPWGVAVNESGLAHLVSLTKELQEHK